MQENVVHLEISKYNILRVEVFQTKHNLSGVENSEMLVHSGMVVEDLGQVSVLHVVIEDVDDLAIHPN